MEAVFFGLLGLGFVVLGPIAFFLTLGARTRLELAERKVKALEVRLADVETGRGGAVAARRAAEPDETRAQPASAPETPETPGAEAKDWWTRQAAPRAAEPETLAQEPAAVGTAREPVTPEQGSDTGTGPLPGALPHQPARDKEISAMAGAAPEVISLPGGALPPIEPPASSPSAAPAPGAPASASFEERLGTRWAVWVGGIALSIGALLLVRQAILQGFFGPGFRIFLGLLFSAALVGAGEWLRRRERGSGDAAQIADTFSFERPSIPAMLTAAGTIGAFGSVYAAHALYGFIGPALAFIALGAIGIATMFAAALHGPMLAGIGLIGAMASPLLVTSKTPPAWPVVLYLAVVACAAYALARLRIWLWLAVAAAIGAALWCIAFLGAQTLDIYHAAIAHLLIQTALALFVLCYEPLRHTPQDDSNIDKLSSLTTFFAGMLVFAVLARGSIYYFDGAWIGAAAMLVILFAAVGLAVLPSITAAVVAGVITLAVLVIWRREGEGGRQLVIAGLDQMPVALPASANAFSIFALLLSPGLAAACAWRVLSGPLLKPKFAAVYAGVSVLTPLLALIIVYLRFTRGETSTLFASLACALALGFTLLAHLFRNGVRDGQPQAWNLALGIYASAAIAALALGVVLVLDGGTLTVALGLAALGAAFVSVRLDIPALRWCVVGLGIAVAARYMWEPRISSNIGATPIFNWLLFGYGVPALAFGYAARMMRLARGEDLPVRIAEALAILCSALLVFFEIRHFMNGGDPFANTSKLIEIGLFTIASLAFALVLMRLDLRRRSPVMNYGSYIFAIVAMVISVIGLGLAVNPLFAQRANLIEGGSVLNALLLGYLLPGLMALLIGRLADGLRPRWYVIMMRVAAVTLIFGYLSLQIRRAFQGANIHMLRHTSDGEWYTYSIAWLGFGVALLAYGLWRRSVEVRLASAIFIVLSVVKVFLFDLGGLEGVLRALSFIGLGLVLIGIGLVYQKFVFVRKAPEISA